MDFTVMTRDKIESSNRFTLAISGFQYQKSLQAANSKAVTVNNGFHPIIRGFRKSIKLKTS
jgi:hypothetical protein